MTTPKDDLPSLLQPESRGGDTAEGGFSFQEQYVLSQIPRWLANEGFDSFIREAMGDTEAKFFVPMHGYQIELIEVKDSSLLPQKFWDEIKRFQELERGSPGTYRWFTLVSTGLSDRLQPLANGLRRIRSPYGFYEHDSGIEVNSYRNYVEIVESLGKAEKDARFLFEKVFIVTESNPVQSYGKGIFIQNSNDHLPIIFKELPVSAIESVYAQISTLVRSKRNKPISRRDILSELRSAVSSSSTRSTPISIHTVSSDIDERDENSLEFDLTKYWGGAVRDYPPVAEWRQLVSGFEATRDWIARSRDHRQLRLTGSRRLSSIIAFGAVFSSVSGFSIEVNHRGAFWKTNESSTDGVSYPLQIDDLDGERDQLVVSISIGRRDTSVAVKSALLDLGLAHQQQLYIRGADAVLNPEQANLIVLEIKDILTKKISETDAKLLHLFYAGPSHLALFLGHRLNAVSPTQLYEWGSGNQYASTCLLYGDR